MISNFQFRMSLLISNVFVSISVAKNEDLPLFAYYSDDGATAVIQGTVLCTTRIHNIPFIP